LPTTMSNTTMSKLNGKPRTLNPEL